MAPFDSTKEVFVDNCEHMSFAPPSQTVHPLSEDAIEVDVSATHRVRCDTSETVHVSRHVTAQHRSNLQVTAKKNGGLADKQAEACKMAKAIFERDIVLDDTRLLDMTGNFPKFLESEINFGEVLGKGGFGVVSEVRGFALEEESSNSANERRRSLDIELGVPDREMLPGEMENRKFMSNHVFRKSGNARYAIKKLKKEISSHPGRLVTGLADLVNEARILSAMEHPNIVKLRAIKAGDRFTPDFFIVMDRLYETLEDRIQLRKEKIPRKTLLYQMNKMFRPRLHENSNYQDSIVAAFHISSALRYMHKQRLIHRDLKPENVGFDARGDIKIFDFGLAKEMPPHNGFVDAVYLFTAMCGSPRYMAEEVALGNPYNEKSDVYSFAVMLWEMLSLRVPFASFSMRGLQDQVWSPPYLRPNLDKLNIPKEIETLLVQCWHSNYRARPHMKDIAVALKRQCMTFPNVTMESLGHRRRKSRVIFDKQNALFRLNPNEFEGKLREYKM
eukprot:Nitzschia sp. Nitz4//scaffold238_size30058//26817//28322//NITZ4_008007-RA/size30058-processed-gene-0.57-mRNA-1//1//CDS//3329543552//7077//frame0